MNMSVYEFFLPIQGQEVDGRPPWDTNYMVATLHMTPYLQVSSKKKEIYQSSGENVKYVQP